MVEQKILTHLFKQKSLIEKLPVLHEMFGEDIDETLLEMVEKGLIVIIDGREIDYIKIKQF